MKTIGIDCSLSVCKAEGYTMMQYDARKKFNKYEYQTSEEAIIETIKANKYDFIENGERY
ncbi:MAG: hypothetical protein WC827_04060 [Candidatus Paceibacterota bacterium]|jgi:hypothetical protein